MTNVYKEFPRPSVDNPALLQQFAQTLAQRYGEMFPTARGFALQLKENMVGKTFRGWKILILHGFYSGVQILISPDRHTPQLITVKVSDDSRLKQTLQTIASILAFLVTAPIFLAAIFKVRRILFALILCAPIWFVVGAILLLIVHIICRLFRPLDHYFDESTQSRLLAIANEIPLPTTLDRSNFPTPPPPPPQPIPAFPVRRGPFGIKS